jgi:alkylhydroperoxidase family enzyme
LSRSLRHQTKRRNTRTAVASGAEHAKTSGESDQRLFAVSAWRDAPYFTDAERAALALTEAVTRLSKERSAYSTALKQMKSG